MQTVRDAGRTIFRFVDGFSNLALHVVSRCHFRRGNIGLNTVTRTVGTLTGKVVGHGAAYSEPNMHGLLFGCFDGFSKDVILHAQTRLLAATYSYSTSLKTACLIPREGAIVVKSKWDVHRFHGTTLLDLVQANLAGCAVAKGVMGWLTAARLV